MIRTEDIIKQSGIIEYLEERLKEYQKHMEYLKKFKVEDCEDGTVNKYIIKELEHIKKHFEEMIK